MKLLVTLDLQFFAGEKTEKATPKKRQDARKKGQVLKSQDVTAAFLLLLMFIFLFFAAPSMQNGIFGFLYQSLAFLKSRMVLSLCIYRLLVTLRSG